MVMRVGGLASGMDIDALVEKLMTAERTPLNKAFQQKQTFEWQRDAYRQVNTKTATYKTYLKDNFAGASSFKGKTATSSNEALVGVSGGTNSKGSLSIEGVSQLAKAAQAVGSKTDHKADTKLSDIGITDSSIALKAIGADGKLAAEATTIELKEGMTVGELVKSINDSGAGVTAIFENGQMSITAKNTGKSADGSAEIVATGGNAVFEKLGFGNSAELANNGQNAKFKINGIETERSTNKFSMNGYAVELKSTFNADGAQTVRPVELNVTVDKKGINDKVKDFVNKYNEFITDMNAQLKEKKYRDYAPLTKEQREDMSEREQKLWDEKSKSGLLRGDSMIRDSLSSMRSALVSSVDGLDDKTVDALYEIGISTSMKNRDGQLEIDEKKLEAAIEKNPDQVVSIFSKLSPADGTGYKDSKESGLAERLIANLDKMEANIVRKAGKEDYTNDQFSIGSKIKDSDKRMDVLQAKMKMVEARYWKQFSAMEQAINKANSQSGFFGQMGGQ